MTPVRSLLLGAALAAHTLQGATDPAPRPNILFLFADDLGRHTSGYAALDERPTANSLVRTPHLDRLGAEGATFRNAFVVATSCTPSRSSVTSGRYWWNTGLGAILRGAEWDPAIPSFPLLLRESGYHIGKSLKVWSPGDPLDGPFDGQRHAYEAAGRTMNTYSQTVTALMAGGVSRDDAHARLMAEVVANFEAFLADRRGDRPWLYWFGPTNPHRSWTRGSGKALWGIDPDRLEGLLTRRVPDVPVLREDFADYLGEIQAFDASVGALLARLAATGELDRTIILVSGDHGIPGFPGGKCDLYDLGTAVPLIVRVPGLPGGRVIDDFVSLVDLAPTILDYARVGHPPAIDGRSLYPLLQSGRSGQVEADRTAVVAGRERHVAEAREGLLPYPMRALRTRDHLYIRNFHPDRWPMGAPLAVTEDSAPPFEVLERNTRAAFADFDSGPTKAWLIHHRNDPAIRPYYERAFGKRPAEELYDLRTDPDQIHNLAGDPKHETTRAALAARLLATLERHTDPRVTGDGSTFDNLPFTKPAPP